MHHRYYQGHSTADDKAMVMRHTPVYSFPTWHLQVRNLYLSAQCLAMVTRCTGTASQVCDGLQWRMLGCYNDHARPITLVSVSGAAWLVAL